MAKRQSLVIHSRKMQDRRVEVGDADRRFRHLHSIVVGLSGHHGLFDTRAGQSTTEDPCMMTRTGTFFTSSLCSMSNDPKVSIRMRKVICTNAFEVPRNRDRTVNALRRDTERRVAQLGDKFRRR